MRRLVASLTLDFRRHCRKRHFCLILLGPPNFFMSWKHVQWTASQSVWLTNWLSESQTTCLSDWWIDCLIVTDMWLSWLCPPVCLTDWLIVCLTGNMAEWLTKLDYLTDRLSCWLTIDSSLKEARFHWEKS